MQYASHCVAFHFWPPDGVSFTLWDHITLHNRAEWSDTGRGHNMYSSTFLTSIVELQVLFMTVCHKMAVMFHFFKGGWTRSHEHTETNNRGPTLKASQSHYVAGLWYKISALCKCVYIRRLIPVVSQSHTTLCCAFVVATTSFDFKILVKTLFRKQGLGKVEVF